VARRGQRKAAGARRAAFPWWPASYGRTLRRSRISAAIARRFRMNGGQPGPARGAPP